MRELNGLLGIQDRNRNKRPAVFVDTKTGESYEVDRHGTISLAKPVIRNEQKSDGVIKMNISGGNQKQLDDWISEKKKSGYKVMSTTPRLIKHKSSPVKLTKESTISNKVTLRESARITLNFLAHYYPAIARSSALLKVENYIMNEDASPCAFYTLVNIKEFFGENAFRFGHRVALVYDSSQKHLYAFIDYFSSLTIVVSLGQIVLHEPMVRIIDINPLAEQEPYDIQIQEGAVLQKQIIPFLPINEENTNAFFDNIEMRLSKLNRDIHKFQREQINKSALLLIKKGKGKMNEAELFKHLACVDVLIYEDLREKLLIICDNIVQLEGNPAGYQVVVDVLRSMIGFERSTEIHPSMVAIVEVCRRKAARLIKETFSTREQVTIEYLTGLLSDKGVIGYGSAFFVDRLVRGTLGDEGYQSLAKKLYSE